MEIIDVLKNRRSVRKYRPDPVADSTVELILEAARWAPSWANTQCWRFILVRDAVVKEELADTLIGISGKAGQSLQIPPDGEVIVPKKGISERPNRAAEAMRQAPLAVVACAELGKSGYYRGDPGEAATDKGDWYMFDVALAMHNLVLAAHSQGLGTVYVGAFDARKAAQILSVPSGYAVVAMTPLGYPDETPAVGKRKELAEIVFQDRFGQV